MDLKSEASRPAKKRSATQGGTEISKKARSTTSARNPGLRKNSRDEQVLRMELEQAREAIKKKIEMKVEPTFEELEEERKAGNRLSAFQSRQRRKKIIEDLENLVTQLTGDNQKQTEEIARLRKLIAQNKRENERLRGLLRTGSRNNKQQGPVPTPQQAPPMAASASHQQSFSEYSHPVHVQPPAPTMSAPSQLTNPTDPDQDLKNELLAVVQRLMNHRPPPTLPATTYQQQAAAPLMPQQAFPAYHHPQQQQQQHHHHNKNYRPQQAPSMAYARAEASSTRARPQGSSSSSTNHNNSNNSNTNNNSAQLLEQIMSLFGN